MSKAGIENEQELEELDVAPEVLEAEEEMPEGEEDAAPEDSDEEELIVTIGEESPPQEDEKRAPEWVRKLRKDNREKDRRIRELEARVGKTEQQKQTQLGPKPTLADCDYDEQEFEKRFADWTQRKAIADRQAEEEKAAAKQRQEYFNSKFEAYSTRKAEVAGKIRDFDEVEETVRETFDETQLGVVLAHAKDPALLLYAIGKDEKRLQELAKIKDPVEYIFAVARMETQLRTSSRKPSSAPEKSVKGSASTTSSDKRMDQLIAEAQRTGDGTKLRQYRASLKQKK